MRIAILGVPGSGKSRLARELSSHLSELQVDDAPALAALRPGAYDRVLCMGLDLPSLGTEASAQLDTAIRSTLGAQHISYAVVYGTGPQRLQAALRHLYPEDGPAPRWNGVCEKCSDPDCELRTLLPRF
jgi:hypothetical protein